MRSKIEGYGGGTVKASIALLLVLSACATTPIAGDFCDVSEPIHLHNDIAKIVVYQDRQAAVKLDAHNRYGEQFCGW